MLQYYKERFGYILTFTALLVFVEVSHAFQPRPNKSKTASTQTEWASFDTNDPIDIFSQSNNPKVSFEVVDKVDLDKARDFAGNFGKYSYAEVEHMRDDLHAHRSLNDSPSNILFLERVLEDELTSQLNALKETMPDPYLFQYPNQEIPSAGLFIENADTPEDPAVEKKVPGQYGKLLGEGVVESLAMCLVLGLLMMSPHDFV